MSGLRIHLRSCQHCNVQGERYVCDKSQVDCLKFHYAVGDDQCFISSFVSCQDRLQSDRIRGRISACRHFMENGSNLKTG